MGGDRLELPVVVDVPLDHHRVALGVGAVEGRETALGVEDVGQRRAGLGQEEGAEQVGFETREALGLGVVLGPVVGELDRDVLGGQPVEGDAEGGGVLVRDVPPGEQVGAVAVVLQRGEGQLAAQPALDEGPGDAELDVLIAVVAAGERDAALGRVGQRLADVLDGAADRVLAVQRALRAAQHLDPLDVEHVQQRALRAGDVDVVQVEADARIDAPERVGLADAAHEGGEGRRLVAAGVDRQVRHAGLDLGDVRGGLILEDLAPDHGHRHRHLLHVLLPLAGGDGDDLADRRRPGGLLGLLLGLGGLLLGLLGFLLRLLRHQGRGGDDQDPCEDQPESLQQRRAPGRPEFADSSHHDSSSPAEPESGPAGLLRLVASGLGNRPYRSRRMNSATAFSGLMPKWVGAPKHFSTV